MLLKFLYIFYLINSLLSSVIFHFLLSFSSQAFVTNKTKYTLNYTLKYTLNYTLFHKKLKKNGSLSTNLWKGILACNQKKRKKNENLNFLKWFSYNIFSYNIFSYNIKNFFNYQMISYHNIGELYAINLKQTHYNYNNYNIEEFPNDIYSTLLKKGINDEKELKTSIEKQKQIFYWTNKTFDDLQLHTALIEELKNNNIIFASIIQEELFSYYNNTKYENLKHIILAAENGIGKTLAYIIFILNHLLKKVKQEKEKEKEKKKEKNKQISNCFLIVLPNNLLCEQCHNMLQRLTKNIKVKTVPLKSDTNINMGHDSIFITTPLKLYHILNNRKENMETFLKSIQFVIIDEADIIFEEHYTKYITFICTKIAKNNNNFKFILTSSTLPTKGTKSIYNNIMKYVKQPKIIKTNYLHNVHPFLNYYFINFIYNTETDINKNDINKNDINKNDINKNDINKTHINKTHINKTHINNSNKNETASIDQSRNVNEHNSFLKCKVITDIILKKQTNFQKILIFCGTINSCNIAYNLLKPKFEKQIFLLNSSLPKKDQLIILENFKNIDKGILVTTDILYRGINIKGISDLFHFDTPTNVVIYTHRNGRISRGGSFGNVYLFKNKKNLIAQKIYAYHKNEIKFEEIFSRNRSLRRDYKRANRKKI